MLVSASLWMACTDGAKDAPPTPTDTHTGTTAVDLGCADLDAGEVVPFVLTGNSAGRGGDSVGSCGGDGEDHAIRFRAPAAGDYLFDTHWSPGDTVLYALEGCGGAELGCDDDGGVGWASHLVVSLEAGQDVILVVDGAAGGGPFVVTGTALSASEAVCQDGFDDDGDQLVDCVDPDCGGACAPVCPDLAPDEKDVTAGGLPNPVAGATTGALDQVQPSCGTGPSSDRTVSFEAPTAGRYGFALSTAETPFDSTLALLDGCGGAELACADVGGFGGEAVAVSLAAGQQVVAVVDGYAGDFGPFVLEVFTPLPAELDCGDGVDEDVDGGADCADPDCVGVPECLEDCANGLDDDADRAADCLDPDCDQDPACAEDCTDGADQDLDGLVDCVDPGCDFDPACPEDCTNHFDDDEDGYVDCADGACAVLPECGGGCPDLVVAASSVAGTTSGADDTLAPSCGGPGSPEVTVAFTPTETGTYVFDTLGSSYDTVLALLSDCGGFEVACNDDGPGWLGPSQVALAISAGDTVVAVIDGLSGGSGDFVLNVTQAPDEELDCADGLDEDYDGAADCADAACVGDPACGTCPAETLAGALPIVASGTTSGTSELSGSCGYGDSPERTFGWDAPADGTYTFSTAGSSFDTVMYVLDACGGAELACSDDSAAGSTSEVQLFLTAGQSIVIVVDGYGGAAGDYQLTVE